MTAVRVRVLFFGPSADAAGTAMRELDLPAEATVGDLAGRLDRDHPGLAAGGRPAFAVAGALAGPERKLAEGDTVAVLPPVSGG